MTRKRILLCTFGSLGDLHPFLALAQELSRRGHSPIIATTPVYPANHSALIRGRQFPDSLPLLVRWL